MMQCPHCDSTIPESHEDYIGFPQILEHKSTAEDIWDNRCFDQIRFGFCPSCLESLCAIYHRVQTYDGFEDRIDRLVPCSGSLLCGGCPFEMLVEMSTALRAKNKDAACISLCRKLIKRILREELRIESLNIPSGRTT